MVGERSVSARTRRGRRERLAVFASAVPVAWGAVLLSVPLAAGSAPARSDIAIGDGRPPQADRLLGAIVRDGWVDYAALERERALLDDALADIGSRQRGSLATLPESDRLAFYLNAYNLATLDLVDRERRKRRGKLTSIQEIPAAWTRPSWKIAGFMQTLDGIEHEILRKEFREPRIHMALVCASVSCPALRAKGFHGPRLEEQLNDASRAFLNDSTRNRLTPHDGAIWISKIFDWYGGDFVGVYRDSTLERLYGEKEGAVLAFAARYVPEETSAAWKARRLRIESLPYDWALNDWRSNAAPAGRR